MRWVFCDARAGLFRKVWVVCTRVVAVVEKAAGRVGLGEMVDLFAAEGLTREQVDCVLDAHIGGEPTLRAPLPSEGANALMRGLGKPGAQPAAHALPAPRPLGSVQRARTRA